MKNFLKISQILKESSINQSELKTGIEIEKEHKDVFNFFKNEFQKLKKIIPISETEFYKMIAKSHLKEIPDYYVRLKKMEDEAKNT